MSRKKDPTSAPQESIPFEQLLERLRAVVGRLENGQLPLEDALAAYEEGVSLARQGQSILAQAEKRVELIVRGPGGEISHTEFDSTAPHSS